ncbi:MAG: UDP-N-acetylmuramoyl-tripeptide--D-alanyl-D-alanine ligase [Acidobacteria bacterium]|nr:UDP-N-acetylmuramoyl-tripeptide--D-alanyl-D-alanine ligase [Acidobacteriota bacterium]
MAVRRFDATEAAGITGGKVAGREKAGFAGVALDSRSVREGNLFVALKGAKSDGHDYCADAILRGASALLVERRPEGVEAAAWIEVQSTELALRRLGAAARESFKGTVIGVVGSCGKTTTKDFTAAVLSTKARVSATSGNRNNLLGAPETMLNADQDSRFWVLELGISRPGEMEELAPVARPNGVIFTTIQPVHTEFFPSLEAILAEKSKVMRWLREPGFVVVNADDPLLENMAVPKGARRLSYGRSYEADVRIEAGGEISDGGLCFTLRHESKTASGFLPVVGEHQLANFAAACAAGVACGLQLEEAAAAAEKLKPARHRGELLKIAKGAVILDDSYNANPAAMESVLRSVSKLNRRVVAVLGEMLELGPEAAAYHAKTGRIAGEVVSALAVVGSDAARPMAEEFAKTGHPCLFAGRWQEAMEWVRSEIKPGDLLLVKGSRGIGLDGLVEALASEGGGG